MLVVVEQHLEQAAALQALLVPQVLQEVLAQQDQQALLVLRVLKETQ
jgi:hypothetical protein